MKTRCRGCRRLCPPNVLLCDLCMARVPYWEGRMLSLFLRDYHGRDRLLIMDRWVRGIIQAIQQDRLAERQLLTGRRPGNRLP